MNNNISKPPIPKCEPVKSYAPNSIERTELQAEYKKAMNKVVEIPMWINGKHIKSKKKKAIDPPHNHKHIVAHYYEGNSTHVNNAKKAAIKAKSKWETMCWQERASIFLKAVFKITLAVFLPTPGSDSKDARQLGTSPSWLSSNNLQVFRIFFALVLNKPIVCMCFLSFSSPSFNMLWGVLATS